MPRRRRYRDEDHENHDRWLVSYADFITLLFAFFVVMYAISSVSEGKYRVLSSALEVAFRSNPAGSVMVLPSPSGTAGVMKLSQPGASNPAVARLEADRQVARERMRKMAVDIQQSLSSLVKEGKVRVTEGPQGISVEINASVLFAPGDARLGPSAVAVLRSVAQVLASSAYPVTVEGHTDNTPIDTEQFPSNWELSVVRASTVVRLFQESGVAAWRLTATGYGEERPVASNATSEGRARNRRVNIVIDAPVGPGPVPVPLQGGPETAAGPRQPEAPAGPQPLAPATSAGGPR